MTRLQKTSGVRNLYRDPQSQLYILRSQKAGVNAFKPWSQAVDEFVAKVRAENPDALAERKPVAAREKADKESALPAIRETLFQLGTQKKDLEKAGDAAADFRQQAESCAATLRQDAARFLRLGLAGRVKVTTMRPCSIVSLAAG